MAVRQEGTAERPMHRQMGRSSVYPWETWDDGHQWAIYEFDNGRDITDEDGSVIRPTSFHDMNAKPDRDDYPEGKNGDDAYDDAVAQRDEHFRGDFGWPTKDNPGGVSPESMVGNIHSWVRRRDRKALTRIERQPGWPAVIYFQLLPEGADDPNS